MGKKNRYYKKQEQYFKRAKKESGLNHVRSLIAASKTPQGTRVKANSYILVNPAFDINVVYGLLNVHNKVNAGMILIGKTSDFEENPREVYRVVNEEKIIELKQVKHETENEVSVIVQEDEEKIKETMEGLENV